jgi:hypothetical protein
MLEREIEHLNADGSRKRTLPGWPSQENIDKAYVSLEKFNKKLSSDNSVVYFSHLVPYIKEHLKKIGGLSGVINYGSPRHYHEGEYLVENIYNFLGKEVKGSIKLDKEEFSNLKSLVFEDFVSYFPNNAVQDLGDGNVILR